MIRHTRSQPRYAFAKQLRPGELRIAHPSFAVVAGGVLAARAELLPEEHVLNPSAREGGLQLLPPELRIEAAIRSGPDVGHSGNTVRLEQTQEPLYGMVRMSDGID